LPENLTCIKKPSPSQIIDLIRAKAVEMYGVVFAVKRAEAITVYSERAAIPDELRAKYTKYERAGVLRYAGMLVKDLFALIFNGNEDKIQYMPGD
jgi:hypothetical protein